MSVYVYICAFTCMYMEYLGKVRTWKFLLPPNRKNGLSKDRDGKDNCISLYSVLYHLILAPCECLNYLNKQN